MLLRNDAVLVVALAVAAPPSSGPYFGATTTYPMVSGLTQRGNAFELGDMDADGDLDVIATTTTTKIVWRTNNGNGTFAATATAGAGLITEKIAVGKIDGDTKADVVVSGSMGRFAYLKSTGAGWAAAKVYDLWPGEPTPGMPIALGAVCRGSPTKLSVAAAYFDEVKVVCGNGGDGFDNVVEPHGETWMMSPVDYFWNLYPAGGHGTNNMLDIATWSGATPGEVYALSNIDGGYRVDLYYPSACLLEMKGSDHILPAAVWGGMDFRSITVHKEAKGDATWGGISAAGSQGLLCAH